MENTIIKEEVIDINSDNDNKKIKFLNWGWYKLCKCIFGLFVSSLAINLFLVPNNLYTGGLLGLAQLIRSFLISTFNLNFSFDISSIIYYIINIPLLILAYKEINKEFLYRTIFSVTINSLFLMLIPIPEAPLVDDTLTNTVIGGILCGIGIGMILSTGSSTGGVDIIGIVLNKKHDKITVGNVGLMLNVFVYAITGLNYGIRTMIYSIISATFKSFMLDKNNTLNLKSEVLIFTKNDPQQIIRFINYKLKRGATYWEAYGGYTNTKTYIVYSVLNKYERLRLERHIDEFDKSSFIVGDDGVKIRGFFNKNMI